MEDGTHLVEPAAEAQRRDLQNSMPTWLPGAAYGEPIATPLNPVLYRSDLV